jgi:hypothetical protein
MSRNSGLKFDAWNQLASHTLNCAQSLWQCITWPMCPWNLGKSHLADTGHEGKVQGPVGKVQEFWSQIWSVKSVCIPMSNLFTHLHKSHRFNLSWLQYMEAKRNSCLSMDNWNVINSHPIWWICSRQDWCQSAFNFQWSWINSFPKL